MGGTTNNRSTSVGSKEYKNAHITVQNNARTR